MASQWLEKHIFRQNVYTVNISVYPNLVFTTFHHTTSSRETIYINDAPFQRLSTVIPRVSALRITALRTYGHFELPPFPEVAAPASELRPFSGMALPPDLLPTTGVAVVCLRTRFALNLFALLCYTL
jgi:hypothetical protein